MSVEHSSGKLHEDNDNVIDITERVKEFKKGKTFKCDCGQGIGVEYGTRAVTCATCSCTLIDYRVGSRELPDTGDSADGGDEMGEQSDLSDFL